MKHASVLCLALVVTLSACDTLKDQRGNGGGSSSGSGGGGGGGGDKVKVIEVLDGQTIKVRLGGGKEKVRLLGIDAPEPPVPGGTAGERYGQEALEFLRGEIQGTKVELVFAANARRDRKGRLLARVLRQGGDVCARMIRQGCATADDRYPHPREKDYDKLEREARKAGKGMWGRP